MPNFHALTHNNALHNTRGKNNFNLQPYRLKKSEGNPKCAGRRIYNLLPKLPIRHYLQMFSFNQKLSDDKTILSTQFKNLIKTISCPQHMYNV